MKDSKVATFNRADAIFGYNLPTRIPVTFTESLKKYDEVLFEDRNTVRKCNEIERPDAIFWEAETYTVNGGKNIGSVIFVDFLTAVRKLREFNVEINP